jgi:hypothetical protein
VNACERSVGKDRTWVSVSFVLMCRIDVEERRREDVLENEQSGYGSNQMSTDRTVNSVHPGRSWLSGCCRRMVGGVHTIRI